MTVGIVGLGLIGGSMAKAYHAAGWEVLVWNRNHTILDFAVMSGVAEAPLTKQNLHRCSLLLIALYPNASIQWLEQMASHIALHTVVIDCCGTKRLICKAGFRLAETCGFTFVGGHPMAGTHNSGFKYARETMFKGASMVLVPPTFDDIELLSRIKTLLEPLQFGRFSVTTAEKHDEMIAFTSQMAHLVSNAYIKSPTAKLHKGFSAGSYKDMTRVAWLNPAMWTELFLENRDCLIRELDYLLDNLQKYRTALADNDAVTLECLLEEGKCRKEEVDGK